MSYGQWKHISGTATWNRSWNWTFKNCSYNVVKRKAVVNNGPDSSCRSIAYGVTSTYKATETNTLGVRTNQYSSTPAC
ncbi:hypothetical protein V6V47_15695 [Micromonospora sp. CPCC 205539]|uniref:hypothetical protein n=1 Tax=Micromonospora sp. CPCC 205539 TaxID=3122408 RepID=UPI002FF09AE6